MAGLVDKLLNYIGIEDDSDYDDYEVEDTVEPENYGDNKVLNLSNRGKKKNTATTNSNVTSFPAPASMKMIVYHPISYEDTQNIIDNLKSRKPVIVNMEELEIDCAQRILDFMAGAIYALNGTIYKVSRGIFVVAPTNYDIIGNGEDAYDRSII